MNLNTYASLSQIARHCSPFLERYPPVYSTFWLYNQPQSCLFWADYA